MTIDSMKHTWSGTVAIYTDKHDTIEAVSVQAIGPAEAVQRAVRAALSGQPRRAEAAFEVSVTLSKENV